MKADLPLSERRRIEREQEHEIRDALVRRHFDVTEDQRLIDAAVLDHALREAPRIMAPALPVPTVVAAPAVVAPPAPSAPS